MLSNVALFPNPASSRVTLAFVCEGGEAQLVVRNVTGQEVIRRDLGVMSRATTDTLWTLDIWTPAPTSWSCASPTTSTA